MEDAVSVLLHHLRVDVEAGVAELSDLLGEQLHTLCRVAEDDWLVDLQLKQRTRALSETGKGAFLHSVGSSPQDRSKCFTLHSLADLFIPMPYWFLWKAFSHAAITVWILFAHTSTTVYSQISKYQCWKYFAHNFSMNTSVKKHQECFNQYQLNLQMQPYLTKCLQCSIQVSISCWNHNDHSPMLIISSHLYVHTGTFLGSNNNV